MRGPSSFLCRIPLGRQREAGGGCCQPVATPSVLQEDVVVMLVSRRTESLRGTECVGSRAFDLGRWDNNPRSLLARWRSLVVFIDGGA